MTYAQAPAWMVQPASYSHSMTVTAILVVDGSPAGQPGDVVGAFVGDEVRGVATAFNLNGAWTFLMTIYANADGETVTYKAYLADRNAIVDLVEVDVFVAGATLGSIDVPAVWTNAVPAAACETGLPSWNVNPADYESTMSITASLRVEGMPSQGSSDLLAAFVGDEVRGVAAPIEVAGQMVYFLTVYANGSGETLSFRLYEANTDLVRVARETLTFEANAIAGLPSSPLAMDAGCFAAPTGQDPELTTPTHVKLLSPYPNPFTSQTTFTYDLSQPMSVRFALYDLLGREVAVLTEGMQPAGTHSLPFSGDTLTPGVYVYRLSHAAHTAHGTVVHTR